MIHEISTIFRTEYPNSYNLIDRYENPITLSTDNNFVQMRLK